MFSVRDITSDGHLTDPDALEAEVKRTMSRRARSSILLVDGSKFGRPALTQITTVRDVGIMLAADAPDDALAPLISAGVDVRRV